MSSNITEYGYTTDDAINKQQTRKKFWNIRNNSSNVSGVLNSETFTSGEDIFTGSKKHVVVSNHCYKTVRVPKFYCQGCYCRKSPVYPKLAIKQPEQQYKKLRKPKCKPTRTYCRRGCQCNIIQHENQSTVSMDTNPSPNDNNISENNQINKTASPQSSIKRAQEVPKKLVSAKQNDDHKLLKTVKHLQVSKNGVQSYEAPISENSDDKNSIAVKKSTKKKIKGATQVQNCSEYTFSATSTSQNEKDVVKTDQTSDLDTHITTDENLKNLNTFRKENYFDCFSTEKLCEEKESDHKCVHKFILNDRLVPEPLHADGFGTSRCTECDKPIKSDILHSSKDRILTEQTTKYHIHISKKSACCASRQSKHKINISAKNDRIEIKVPISPDKYNELFNTSYKIKNPASANSLALRHQKGVV